MAQWPCPVFTDGAAPLCLPRLWLSQHSTGAADRCVMPVSQSHCLHWPSNQIRSADVLYGTSETVLVRHKSAAVAQCQVRIVSHPMSKKGGVFQNWTLLNNILAELFGRSTCFRYTTFYQVSYFISQENVTFFYCHIPSEEIFAVSSRKSHT